MYRWDHIGPPLWRALGQSTNYPFHICFNKLDTNGGVHQKYLCAPDIVHTIRSGVHQKILRAPDIVHTISSGVHQIFWCAPDIVHTIRSGVHQKLLRAPDIVHTISSGVHQFFCCGVDQVHPLLMVHNFWRTQYFLVYTTSDMNF